MTAQTLPMPAMARTRSIPRPLICLAMIAVFTVLVRMPMLGDPAYRIDEQFYVLVGNRMLHGAIPYVDIWDRKPIGLFLIYAAAGVFGEGVIPYQLLAIASVIGTAACIFAISRRVAGDTAATIAAMFYPLWLQVADGGGGQSPIFYGLPVAAAAMLLLQPESSTSRRRDFIAILLIGIALQIKYSVVFEGAFFGMVAAHRAYRRNPKTAISDTLLLAATALAPTLLVIGIYAAIGHFGEFWYANFTSIFQRGETPSVDLQLRTHMAFLRLLPLGLCVLASLWELRNTPVTRGWQTFMLLWCVAAVVGFAAIGALYSHYLLPAFIPFSAAAAPIFQRRPLGWVLAFFCAWLPSDLPHWPDFARTAQSIREMDTLSALVPANVDRGCMQMFDGPPILYHLTHACTVSRFVFPDHLSAAIEAHAIGIDPVEEVNRIFAARPKVITMGDVEVRPANLATFTLIRNDLAAHYRFVGKAPMGGRFIEVFQRR